MTLVMVELGEVQPLAQLKHDPAAIVSIVARAIRYSWEKDAPLTSMVVVSLLSLIFSFAGLCIDHRHISGELAWIKPCKFGISIALYGASLIWMEQYLTSGKKFFHMTTKGALIGAILELGAIITQVLRGTTSHFNDATPIDATLWYMVKISIMPVALAVIVLCILLMRQKNLPKVLGLSLRLGTVLTIVGLVPAIIMILPESAQEFITEVEVNGHTIGFVTGGPGIPWLGWSTVAGDLRAAHFVGLHALQVVPLMGLAVTRYLRQTRYAAADGFDLERLPYLFWHHFPADLAGAQGGVCCASRSLHLARLCHAPGAERPCCPAHLCAQAGGSVRSG